MRTTRKSIEDAIAESLQGLGWSTGEVLPACHFGNDLGVDSIEVVELAAAVWKRCGLPPRSLEVRQVETVGELAARLEALAAQPPISTATGATPEGMAS